MLLSPLKVVMKMEAATERRDYLLRFSLPTLRVSVILQTSSQISDRNSQSRKLDGKMDLVCYRGW